MIDEKESKVNDGVVDKDVNEAIDHYYGLDYENEFDESSDQDLSIDLIEKPFDADKIRIDQEMLSLRYIVELIELGKLELNPEFQRYSVWKEKKRKSLLIESLMLKIPIPAFYFYENKEGKLIVIDGQQRLTTIYEFVTGEFKLSGLEYLSDECHGKTFKELSSRYVDRIFRTQLAVNTLDARSPTKVIYEIFRRVNTGGVSLKPQEIRNAIANSKVRAYLKELSSSSQFLKATRNRIKVDRMDDQELVLRFIAFYSIYDYKSKRIDYYASSIASLLDEKLEYLNRLDKKELAKIQENFYVAMEKCYELFGEFAFNKIHLANHEVVFRNIDVINKSLFTSFAVILAGNEFRNIDLTLYRQQMLIELAKSLDNDYSYERSLTVGTGDRRAIIISFDHANKLIERVIKVD